MSKLSVEMSTSDGEVIYFSSLPHNSERLIDKALELLSSSITDDHVLDCPDNLKLKLTLNDCIVTISVNYDNSEFK